MSTASESVSTAPGAAESRALDDAAADLDDDEEFQDDMSPMYDYEKLAYDDRYADYEAIYHGVNQIARAVGIRNRVECGEVLAIHQMFVRLDTLSVANLLRPERVKHLIVFADVVEIKGAALTLPGSALVLIACRLLHVENRDVELNLSWNLASSSTPPRCSIRAQQVITTSSTTVVGCTLLIQVMHALRWSNNSPFTQYFGRQFSYSSQNSSSTPPSADRFLSSPGVPPSSNLILVNTKTMNILINNIRWKGYIDFQVGLPPLADLVEPRVIDGIESTLLIAEMILNFQTNARDAVMAAKEHIQWINKVLVQVVDGPNSEPRFRLKTLLARVQMLLKLSMDGSPPGLVVPVLEYSRYYRVINELVRVAELYNNEFNQLNLFIQQNQILGDYVLQQSRVLAQREKDVEALEFSIVARKQQELAESIRRVESLEEQLQRLAREMDEAKENMDKGLQVYRDRQIATAFFAVLGAALQLGGSFRLSSIPEIVVGIGGSISEAINAAEKVVDAVASNNLVDVANKLVDVEKVIEVVNAIKELSENETYLEDILNAPEIPVIPSSDWDIMENNMEEVAAGMPTEVSEVVTWKTKSKNVIAVCREICMTAISISEVQYELFVHGKQREIAQRHAERLEQMQAAGLGDYIEIATQVDMQTMRLLIILLGNLAIQNGALNYHYLLVPEPLTSWPTIESVRRHLIQQEEKAILAEEGMGVPVNLTQAYAVEDIPVSLLLDGADWMFTIDPSETLGFPETWYRVRIRYIEMKFTGENLPQNPNTGKVYLLLQASSMFQDRYEGEVFHYEAATPHRYQLAYELDSGVITVPNRPAEEGRLFLMTPFTRWRLRLSASAYENQGVSFPGPGLSTNISITFHVTSIVGIQLYRLHAELEEETQL